MEVLPKRGALLTDAEALQSLRDCARIVNGNRDLSKLFNVQGSLWITKEIDSFCRTTPCASQSTEDIAAFLSRLETAIPGKPFSDKEKVQLVNLRPASLVEVHTIIDNSEERFTEDDILQLLDVIEETLPINESR